MRRFDTDQWIEDGVACVQFEAVPDGPWVTFTDAQSAIDAANQRATEAERQLAASRAIAKTEAAGRDAWSDRAVKAEKELADAERRLALAVAEVKAWRAWAEHPDTYLNDCASQDYVCIARSATDSDPELVKMIGGGE